ncbi:phosphoinositide 3-phosphate phosphatase [Zalerion maritima]|uniref:phosphatidylinositol-3,4,5-trisphosphate 3-phosphatase n=1 Tax=Zalerion maritima TaxID=339359 RepID=A0AAD5WN15_9PEZI|nr:phosphoinositide 3-phosphate phosphatase [Zalerion maritima]
MTQENNAPTTHLFRENSSGPSNTYPKRMYRTPLDRLVKFLDEKHGENWAIWEFRAEGTGYPDDAVYGRIHHFPWPDHHPPPFRLVPLIMGSMRNWLAGREIVTVGSHGETIGTRKAMEEAGKTNTAATGSIENLGTTGGALSSTSIATDAKDGDTATQQEQPSQQPDKSKVPEQNPNRVTVVHCKAGKGRSGSMSVSYLLSECGWTKTSALQRFTERRMLPGFGSGVSIPSQIRWIDYVERWTNAASAQSPNGKKEKRYIDRPVEVLEVHCWGLRNGVEVEVKGFVDEGKKIQVIHKFGKGERMVVQGNPPGGGGKVDMIRDMLADSESAKGSSVKEDGYESSTRDGSMSATPPMPTTTPVTGSGSNNGSSTPKRSASRLLRKGKLAAKAISRLSKSPSTPNNTSTAGAAPSGTGAETPNSTRSSSSRSSSKSSEKNRDKETPGGKAVLFKPSPNAPRIILPTSDINVSLERKSRSNISSSLSVTTAIAHVWFNVFFEGQGPERLAMDPPQQPLESGVFGIDWDAMDGLKGSKRKGVRAVDMIEVVWRLIPEDEGDAQAKTGDKTKVVPEEVREPELGEAVKEPGPADWRGENNKDVDPDAGKRLGVSGADEGKEEPGGPVKMEAVGAHKDEDDDDEQKTKKKDDKEEESSGDGKGEGKAETGGLEAKKLSAGEQSGKTPGAGAKEDDDEDMDMDELKMVKSAGPKGENI